MPAGAPPDGEAAVPVPAERSLSASSTNDAAAALLSMFSAPRAPAPEARAQQGGGHVFSGAGYGRWRVSLCGLCLQSVAVCPCVGVEAR